MNPQSIAALRRRKQNREKFSSLEKRIPLRSKLDTAKMLEAAGKYVKFLEAQVHLLKSMPNGLGSAGTLNPPTKDIIAKGVGMSGSGNVKVDSVTISSAENLSAQEMLYVLLKNNGVEGESKFIMCWWRALMSLPEGSLATKQSSSIVKIYFFLETM
jgi:hypothetical protein